MKISEWGPRFMTDLTLWAIDRTGVVTEQDAREFVETFSDEERIRILASLVVDVTAGLTPPKNRTAA